MRNALLICAGLAALLGLLWLWPGPRPVPPPTAASAPAQEPSVAPPAPPVPSAQPGPQSASTPAPPSAAELTARARLQLDRDPAAALSDLERADQLEGAHHPERRALEIYAHTRLGKVGHARALADRFYRTFPGHPEGQRIERLTGYHPRP